MSDPKVVLQEVQAAFIARIATKNSWGKNEVIEAWQAALIEVLMNKLGGAG
jgi:hypothetical protein